MRSVSLLLLAALVTGAGTVSPAQAQSPFAGQVLFGRSSWENGDLSLFHMNRMPTGARSIGMGMTGLALLGGPSYQHLNPTAALGVTRPSLVAESKFIAGTVSPQNPPAILDLGIGPAGILEASDYRVSYQFDYDYNDLSFAMPITLFGNRGALSALYSRSARTGRETETRVELQGTITNQQEATLGTGDVPDQGLDVLTLGVAREITSFWNLGANFNWYSGELQRQITQGVSVVGTQFSSGASAYQQDASGFNIDLGTQFQFGNLGLGGSVFLEHDLEFKSGRANIRPLPTVPGEMSITFDYVPLDMTVNVPTMVGGGASYQLGERVLVAADFWYRPWSKTGITRQALDVDIGFLDPSDSLTYIYGLVPVPDKQETFSANFEDMNSFSFGVEYLAVHKPGLEVPIRIGYSKGKTTQSNVVIPSQLWEQYEITTPDTTITVGSYVGLIGAYYTQLQTAPNDSLTLAMGNTLRQIDEYNLALFRNGSPDLNTITLGAGVRIKNFTADLGLAFNSFTWTRFFLQPFDPVANPTPALVTEKRSVTDIVFSLGMSF